MVGDGAADHRAVRPAEQNSEQFLELAEPGDGYLR
jgi:hypothetical protein